MAIARALFKQGVEFAASRQWDEAADAFERSLKLSPRPITVFNLAGAQAATGRIVAGIENYRRFIRSANAPRYSGYVRAARSAIAELEPKQARLQLEVRGLQVTDRVTLDGRPLDLASVGVPIPVDPGAHEAAVHRDDQSESVEFSTEPGQFRTVTLTAPIVPVSETPEAADRAILGSGDGPGDKTRSRRSAWLWTAAGVAVVTALSVGAYYAFRSSDASPFDGTHGPYRVDGVR